MKRRTLIVLAITLTSFLACRKEHKAPDQINGTTRQRITFGVTADFTGQIVPGGVGVGRLLTTTATPTIPNTFDTIFYKAYDTVGHIIHQKSYSAKTFTSISDTLSPGDYRIAIYAGKKGFNGADYGVNPNGSSVRFDANTFGRTFPLTVGGSNINQNITINRIVGELTFTITDAFPAKARRFVITLDAEQSSYDTFNGNPTGLYNISPPLDKQLPVSFAGTTGFTYTFVTLNTTGNFNVELAAYDNATQLVGYKYTNPITLTANEHLSLSGYLFSNNTSGSSSVTVGIDTTWRPQPVTFTY